MDWNEALFYCLGNFVVGGFGFCGPWERLGGRLSIGPLLLFGWSSYVFSRGIVLAWAMWQQF